MFLNAGWLALLVPWMVLAIVLWRRTANERATTASFLWFAEHEHVPRERPRRGPPPAWVIATLVALLAMIFALSVPAYRERSSRVAVIVDPSVSMTATASNGRSLRDGLIDRCRDAIAQSNVHAELEVHVGESAVRDLEAARAARFDAAAMPEALTRSVDRALEVNDAVIVLSDHVIERQDDRLAVIAPTSPADNVGIASAVAVERPRPALMVRIHNDSTRAQAVLEVRSGRNGDGPSTLRRSGESPGRLLDRRVVKLPGRGEGADVFIDLPPLESEVEVALTDLNDALPMDDSATLFRTTASPRLVVDAGAPDVATRFAAAYEQRGTSVDASGLTIRLVDDREVVTASDSSEIIFARPGVSLTGGDVRLADHPVLRDVGLDQIRPARAATKPTRDDPSAWSTIAAVGDRPILSVRERPSRAVWIGFEVDRTDARSVVLLGNAVDWIAASSPSEWVGQLPTAIRRDWRATSALVPNVDASPGRYVDGAGRAVAVNMPAVMRAAGETRGDVAQILRSADRVSLHSLRTFAATSAGLLASLAGVLYGRDRHS